MKITRADKEVQETIALIPNDQRRVAGWLNDRDWGRKLLGKIPERLWVRVTNGDQFDKDGPTPKFHGRGRPAGIKLPSETRDWIYE